MRINFSFMNEERTEEGVKRLGRAIEKMFQQSPIESPTSF
jgi:DNA-binding transcriptional MocR family regulator